MSEQTGLSIDTLRWYEREGLLPQVGRTSDGRRYYPPAAVGFVRLVGVLRRTGMPVADVREFVQMGGGVRALHPPRLAMLEEQRDAIDRQIVRLHEDRALVEDKIERYRDLLARGVDCEDEIAGS